MARTCVFCGGTPVTREHVWPDWYRKLQNEPAAVTHAIYTRERGVDTGHNEFDQPPFRMTAKVVCCTCNSGWMSRLETEAKQYLEGMVAGRGRELHAGGQRTLTRWAVKTAMMLDLAMAGIGAVPASHHSGFGATHEPPPGTQVWIAAYAESLNAYGQRNAFELSVAGKPEAVERNVWLVAFTIGPVAFRVLGTTEPGLYDYDWGTMRNVDRIWPSSRSLTWTLRPAFTDIAMHAFATAPHTAASAVSEVVEP